MISKLKSFLFVAVVMAMTLSGCLESAEIVVANQSANTGFDLSHGMVYDIDVIVENIGNGEGSADVTVNLISDTTGVIRDAQTKTVTLKPGQSRQLTFVLDGDIEDDYNYTVEIN